MHRVLLSDLGNVVIFFDRRRVAAGLHALIRAKSVDEIDRLVHKSEEGGTLLEQFETGAIDALRYRQEIERLLDTPIPADDFWRIHTDLFTPNMPVMNLWRTLRSAGVVEKIIAVTDTDPVRLNAGMAPMLESCGLTLDGPVASCYIGRRKPHPAMFEAAIRTAGVPLDQCIFVDDNPAYADAAAKIGIGAVCYRSREANAQEMLLSDLLHLGLSM
ncbi:MAG: HAD-IA family hydrolase [Candidatus Sungbacteria bacterium]|uniref:HAD-IA family hydrolase n=1 Tax=Candidatus Sungiibacteriota bacterium TaxID=2750080 RepID=A0A932VQX6_9BACT|nr:HAD-IA family hydrolase [Candidatus Sungbacteria bacterium]